MAETKIGGILFTDFYYQTRDAENIAGGVADGASTNEDDWGRTQIQVPNISRMYIRWTNEHNVGLYFETGTGDDFAGESGDVSTTQGDNETLRHFYGWWDVTPGFQIMVGHSTTPFSPLNPNQLVGTRAEMGVHIIGAGYGEYYSGRYPQVRFTFKFSDAARLAVAFVDPGRGSEVSPTAEAGTAANFDSKMPRIDIGVPLTFGPVKLYPSMYYVEKTFDNAASGSDDSFEIYGLSLGLSVNIGPVKIEAEGQMGQNWANSGDLMFVTAPTANAGGVIYDPATGDYEDSDCWAYWIDLSFKLGPGTLHLLWGQASAENDATSDATKREGTATMYGVQMDIPLAKTFLISPEIMFYDWDDSNKLGVGGANPDYDYGKQAIYGVSFRIVF
jgi:hypothetical protein